MKKYLLHSVHMKVNRVFFFFIFLCKNGNSPYHNEKPMPLSVTMLWCDWCEKRRCSSQYLSFDIHDPQCMTPHMIML